MLTMKATLTLIACLFTLVVNGQHDSLSICSTSELDESFVDCRKTKDITEGANIIEELLQRHQLKDDKINRDRLLDSLEEIINYETLFSLRNRFTKYLDSIESNSLAMNPRSIYKYGLAENLNQLDFHMAQIMKKSYLLYDYHKTSKRFFKSIHIYHDNDFFMLSEKNMDRDYTGGFRFELTTDQLKLRVLKNYFTRDDVLTYQSFFIGGEGYTPYIRFTEDELDGKNIPYEIKDGFFTEMSLDTITSYLTNNQELSDRPFASFQYLGRGKYRMQLKGKWRSTSLVKIGFVGKKVGENIQALLHRDITKNSQRVLNWDRQIAQGGRLAINVDHKIDFMLLSKQSNYLRENGFEKFPSFINIYFPFHLSFGTVHTYYSTLGIGITTQPFNQTSGHGGTVLKKINRAEGLDYLKSLLHNTNLFIEYNRRTVMKNTLLTGFGADDPLDDEANTIYNLEKDDISNHIHFLNVGLHIRLERLTIYYKQTRLMNKEFSKRDISNPNTNFQTPNWYGWGTVGFNVYI